MVRKLKRKTTETRATLIKMKDNEHVINFNNNTVTIMERFYKALDLLEENKYYEAETIFESITNQVKGHFDSIVSLITLYQDRGHFPNVAKAFNKGIKDMRFVQGMLPAGATLPWTYSQNKGFLKFVYNLGIRYLNKGKLQDAETTFKFLLEIDPEDYLDATEVLIEVYFEMNDSAKVLSLTEDYSKLNNNSTIYSRILAHLALDQREEATKLIEELSTENISVYKLLDKEVEKQRDITEYISYSAIEDKAQFYWNNFFRYWEGVDGALDFLENHLLVKEIKEGTPEGTQAEASTNLVAEFKKSLVAENLKEITISNHLNNLELFKDKLHSLDEVVATLEAEVESLNKTVFTKTITSLNKFYTFKTEDKEELKGIKAKLKVLKDTHIVKF